jgi:UPF0755 protein
MINIQEKIKNSDYLKDGKPNFVLVFLIILLFIGLNNTTAPVNFAEGKLITIEKGQTIKNTGELLKEQNIIRSETLFNVLVTFKRKNVVEGKYLFHTNQNLFKVIDRVTKGSYEIPTERITFIEGETSFEMAEKLKYKFPNFDVDTFYELAILNEGYLFPDTYNFKITVSAEEVIKEMKDNFNQQIEEISDLIEESERSLEDIIKMASIIEGESDADNRQQISNVLWKRIDIDMPLQVDATFVYSIGKSTFDLTLQDLNDKNNPYNSYEFKGLPPTPINNPGIKAIKAAATQEDTNYLYFLTGRNGITYYATSFEGHKNNRALYLD